MVDFTTLITSSSTRENIKCFVCKNYLSFFPISFCSNNKSVCGRCTIPDGLISFENYAFEEICQHFKFPCRFKNEGCPEEFLPKDIPEHEEKCPFRIIECIVNKPEKCQWQGSLSDLLRHCENQHSDLILENYELEIDPTDVEERDKFVIFEDNLLIFRSEYDLKNKKMRFGLFCSKYQTNPRIFSCQLSVTTDKLSLMCNFETTSFEADMKLNEVYLSSLYSYGKPGTFLMKMTLPENNNVTIVENSEIKTELLKYLECVKCSRITNPPTYNCINCGTSEDTSRGVLGMARLGEIWKFVELPCKYENNGCPFSSKHDTLANHEVACDYQLASCPFFETCWDTSCSWKKLRKDLYSHILEHHEDRIDTSSEKMYQLVTSETCTNMSFIKFSQYLFLLSYDFSKNGKHCKWSVQKISAVNTKYKFEIEIVDEALGRRFVMGSQCSDLSAPNQVFDDCEFCCLNEHQIEAFMKSVDSSVKFKVRIFNM